MALLEVRGLEKWYGRRKVVDGVTFDVNPGEVVGLLGPNGAGKTTSFRMATGQIATNGGTVLFNSEEVTDLPMFRRARLGMGYLSQEQSIFRKLSVEKNLLAILESLPRSRSLGRRLTSGERWERTEQALLRFNLTHVRKNIAARCSGGEKRRLEIARCLVCEPLLILLDEPFAAVDPKTTEDIRKNIRDLANTGIGILLTDHNVREVVKTADRIYLIVEGRVVSHGTPEQLIRDPVAIDAYLGSTFQDDTLMARMAGYTPSRSNGHTATVAEAVELTLAQAPTAVTPPPLPTPAPAPAPASPPPQPSPVRVDLPARTLPLDPPKPPPPSPRPVVVPLPGPVAAPRKQPLVVDDAIPPSIPHNLSPSSKRPPTPSIVQPPSSPRPNTAAHEVIEQETMRRAVDMLMDRQQMPAAWHELASRGDAAVPILLEALERRELEVRHLAHRLLESITGEELAFHSDGPEDARLRETAYLRVRLEKRG